MRITEAPKIDGNLDESIWKSAPVASDFIMFEPTNGAPEDTRFRTEVRMAYDDEAIYIAATMYDPNPDSILRQVTQRDAHNENCDWFGFFLNPYNDGLSDFNFWVTSAGTQSDSRTTVDGDDFGLNSVWKSAAKITEDGWIVEVALPYMALRFPKEQVENWGLNFMRSIRRSRKSYTWNFLDLSSGYRLEYQSGLLTGMDSIDAPIRLSLMPYVSAYLDDSDGTRTSDYNAGLDLKYGLTESFTLDMTLIPDFGQVAYDQQFLNLSPFENRFDENRQFFTEGTELFTMGDVFYSRRIGGAPKNIQGIDLNSNDSVEIRQEYTRLLNATKVSGRTKKNLGIGLLNAVTDNNYSTRIENGEETQVLTEPLTNYNVLVFDQRFNRNSSIGLINTNVLRNGSSPDANVATVLGSFFSKSGIYSMDIKASQSAIFQTSGITDGYEAVLEFGDVEGNWNWNMSQTLTTDDYNINDLGFLPRNNRHHQRAELAYRTVKPSGPFNKYRHAFIVEYRSLYKPYKFEEFYFGHTSFHLTRSFLAFGTDVVYSPFESVDFFEPREAGRWFRFPSQGFFGGWISTDYRKTFALDMNAHINPWFEKGRKEYGFNANPRVRLGNHFFSVFTLAVWFKENDFGYVPDNDASLIHFGRRDNKSVETAIDAQYVFSPKTSLSLKVRHAYTDVDYERFYVLEQDGYLTGADLTGVNDLNFNTFNVDFKFSWWFAPGSEMVILYRNVIASADNLVHLSYLENVNGVWQAPQQNNISIKVTYFLDYNTVRRRFVK